MNRNSGVPTARCAQLLAQHRSLPDIQIKGGWQHEEDRGLVVDPPIDHLTDVIFARVFRRSGWEAGKMYTCCHTEGALHERLKGRRLGFD